MKELKHTSKFLSLVLRHQPTLIGLAMDSEGWVDVSELITKMNDNGHTIDVQKLETIIMTSDKQRFAYNDDKTKIRANQGHSVNVDLQFEAVTPDELLYHGTVSEFIESIRAGGLKKMSRTHVHLSRDRATAMTVGGRRGKPVILIVRAGEMHKDGYKFYLSENQVWLTEEVPARYIEFQSDEA
ncbi:MAG: 2-phosphotransferase [Bacteroidetes bacterium]|nr:2-phosphotransferase [Bacteroidota bacterium]